MKYLKTFESYTFEDFTHSDMEEVTNMSPEDDKNKIHIPIEYSGVIMELGDVVDPNDIISLYNQIVEEGTPLVSYSEYGTEGKFYNEDDDEIPTDVILDELNYVIGLEELDEYYNKPRVGMVC